MEEELIVPELAMSAPESANAEEAVSGVVTLVCRGCGRRMPYLRSNDPDLPKWVETISMSACDLCHDGDRMSEDWLDADGNAPDPDDMT